MINDAISIDIIIINLQLKTLINFYCLSTSLSSRLTFNRSKAAAERPLIIIIEIDWKLSQIEGCFVTMSTYPGSPGSPYEIARKKEEQKKVWINLKEIYAKKVNVQLATKR